MLTQTAINRRRIVTNWIKGEFISPQFFMNSEKKGRTRGALLYRRLLMLAAQVGIPDVNDVHFLDNDTNWQQIEHETKIPTSYYYAHADVSSQDRTNEFEQIDDPSWGPIMFTHPWTMERYFYKTKVVKVDGRIYLRPEAYHQPTLTNGFPDFSIFHADSHLSYEEKVLEFLGIVGGKNSQLSSDTSLRGNIRLSVDGRPHFSIGASTSTYYLDYRGETAELRIDVAPTHPNADIEFISDNPQQFLNDGTGLIFRWKVIAEDDSEQVYTFNLYDAN